MNVYYLSSRTPAEMVAVESEWPSLGTRLRNAWWRFRLALAEIRGILRRPRYRLNAEDYATLLDVAEPVVRRARPAGPACIIDLAAARLRLRP